MLLRLSRAAGFSTGIVRFIQNALFGFFLHLILNTMITSISTNFGVNQLALKCYDSAKIVVLQGSFIINTNKEDYKNSEQLEIEFPSSFSIRNSKPTSAFIVCHKDDLRCGTIIKAQIQDNKLIIEKLPIYDGQGTVKIILASGFVSDANESLLSPASSS